jgi:Lon protease-like protein
MAEAGSAAAAEEVPLFPLRTILFPGGPLPLRIFEARYLDMVSRCLRVNGEFGVLLLLGGTETGSAETAGVGTLARIVDWYQGSDGLLGITATGTDRFELLAARRQADGLNLGSIRRLATVPAVPLPERFLAMAELLRAVLPDLGKLYEGLPQHFDDAGWVGARLAEILPIAPDLKQRCLQLDDPLERLELLQPVLRAVRRERTQ